MGCFNAKLVAVQELQHITNQIKKENLQLEYERDLLKSQHDDRPEEEKESLQDLQVMHIDLEKELKELKELMIDFLSVPDAKDHTFLSIKDTIEKIASVQLEMEEQSEVLRGMIMKRKDLQKDHQRLENLIHQTESQISTLRSSSQKLEWTLKEAGEFDNNKVQEYERKRSIIIETLKNDSSPRAPNEKDTKLDSVQFLSFDEKDANDSLIVLSELEITKELNEVEIELNSLASQAKSLDLNESEKLQIENYIFSLQNKLKIAAKNANFKELIQESEERLRALKDEQEKLEDEVRGLKKNSGVGKNEDVYKKIQELNEILNCRTEVSLAKTMNDSLIFDIEETLRKAKSVAERKK